MARAGASDSNVRIDIEAQLALPVPPLESVLLVVMFILRRRLQNRLGEVRVFREPHDVHCPWLAILVHGAML